MGIGSIGRSLLKAVGKAEKKARKIVEDDHMKMLFNGLGLGLYTGAVMAKPKQKTEADKKAIQEYYNSLSSSEKVKEFYANGGKGITFDKAS